MKYVMVVDVPEPEQRSGACDHITGNYNGWMVRFPNSMHGSIDGSFITCNQCGRQLGVMMVKYDKVLQNLVDTFGRVGQALVK